MWARHVKRLIESAGADQKLVALAKKMGARKVGGPAKGSPFKGWESWVFSDAGDVEEFLDRASGGNLDHPIWAGWNGESEVTMIPPTSELS